MKIAVISSRYPSKNNPYNHMFVHMRCVEMKNQGEFVEVFVPGKTLNTYIHEGVTVKVLPSLDIINEIKNYDVSYLHLLNIYPFSKANGWPIYKYLMKNNTPFIMYVHGSEVQKYGARMFEFNYKFTDFLKWFKKDALVIPKMKKFVNQTKNKKNAAFIFPSIWMKDDLETNLNLSLSNKYSIIPNGIDTNLFEFRNNYSNKHKILTLRPLSSKKYAVDIAIEIMQYLPDNFSLDIYGKGHYEKQYKKQIKQLNLEKRISIKNTFIDRKNLNDFFSNYGVFLAPTRMDAQGVSMCEAMASGLLTVSSNNTAIPEFVVNKQSGIVGNNLQDVAKNITTYLKSEKSYKEITEKARSKMEDITIKKTVTKEIVLLKEIASL